MTGPSDDHPLIVIRTDLEGVLELVQPQCPSQFPDREILAEMALGRPQESARSRFGTIDADHAIRAGGSLHRSTRDQA
jgi:hypothetical protein